MPVQAQRVGGIIAPTVSQSGARRKWMVSTMFEQLYYRKDPVPLYRRLGGPQHWSGWGRKSHPIGT